MNTVLRSRSREVVIGPAQPFCVIGERINPTGRRLFSEQLRNGDLSRLDRDVAEQVAGGAMVLDVNMGAPLADEAALMTQAVRRLQDACDLPLCLDSSIIEVLEAGLAAYEGKALAAMFGLPLTVLDIGTGGLERELELLVGGDAEDQAIPGGSSAARIGAQTTTGGVVVVADRTTIGSSSALPDAAWIAARIRQDPAGTAS
jgi:Pterin binding enzyme